jgi:hypothetical protein
VTSVFDPPWDQSVRLQTLGAGAEHSRERTRWHVRSPPTGHVRSHLELSGSSLLHFLGQSNTGAARSVARTVEPLSNASKWRSDARARPVETISASGHMFTGNITLRDCWRSNERNSKLNTRQRSNVCCRCDRTRSARLIRSTGASGQYVASSTLFITALFLVELINRCLIGLGSSLLAF